MKNSPSRLELTTAGRSSGLTIDDTIDDHPVTVTLKDATGELGCDPNGAGQLRRRLRWRAQPCAGRLAASCMAIRRTGRGVMDITANTDFPDVRQKCLISLK